MARAQFRDSVLLRGGNGLLSAPPAGQGLVAVYQSGTTTPIATPLYADALSSATLSNPFPTGSDGYITFYVASELEFDLFVSAPGYSSLTLHASADAVQPAGSSLPTGGTVGQVLAKNSATDYDASWQAPAGSSLPTGGTTGQVLTKNSATNYDAGWATSFSQSTADARYLQLTGGALSGGLTVSGTLSATTHTGNGTVPVGGTTNQVLAKNSATDYDLIWQTPAGGGLTLPLTQPLTFSPDNTYDIGAAAASRPRNVYAAGAFIGNGAVPTGGTTGQVLAKNSATNYDLIWSTPGGGVTWPLLAPNGLVSAPSYSFTNAPNGGLFYNGTNIVLASGGASTIQVSSTGVGIGQAPTGNALAVSGTIQTNANLYLTAGTGTIGVGTVPVTNIAVNVQSAGLTGSGQYGVYSNPTFGSGSTIVGAALSAQFAIVASPFTMTSGYGLWVQAPINFTSPTVTSMYGVRVDNQGLAKVTNAYGVYIAAQSGATTTNLGLNNQGTSQLQGNVAIGTSPQSVPLYVQGNSQFQGSQNVGGGPDTRAVINWTATGGGYMTDTSNNWYLKLDAQASAGLTGELVALRFFCTNPSSANNITNMIGMRVLPFTRSGAGTINNTYCIYLEGSGVATNHYALYIPTWGNSSGSNYGVYIGAPSGTGTNIGLYNGGSEQIMGTVGLGAQPSTTTALYIAPNYLSGGTSQAALTLAATFQSSATVNGFAIQANIATAATAFTLTNGYALFAGGPSVGAGSAITNSNGLYVGNQGASGITNAYGIYVAAQSGAATSNVALYLNAAAGVAAIRVDGGTSGTATAGGASTPPATCSGYLVINLSGSNFKIPYFAN